MVSEPAASHAPAHLRRLLGLTPDDLNLDRSHAAGLAIRHLIYTCSDGHFGAFLAAWSQQHFSNRADVLAVPGGPLELCLDYHLMRAMLNRAHVLYRLHQTMELWLLFHNGCGGYRHHRKTTDPYQEREHQLQDMAKIETLFAGQGLVGVRLHFGLIRTAGPQWVPLCELGAQARALGLHIDSLERDIFMRSAELPV